MASVYTAPRAPLAATGPSSSSPSSRQLDPNPSRFLAARRGQRLLRVRRLAGAAPTRRPSDAASVFGCSARSPGADSGGERRRGWDALFHDAFQGAVRRWSEYVGSHWPLTPASKEAGPGKRAESSHEQVEREDEVEEDDGDRKVEDEEGKWSWERWKQHFALIEESEGLVDELQLQLRTAVYREDYRSAHKLKLAIAATSRNDTVGRAISDLHRAIEEERYMDAAHIRDHVGAGLLGWWSGISGNLSDPYGLIIRISAEHGRYVAKSYDIRQLASDGLGFPIFEIYFAEANGGYNLQAVHLKPDASDSDQLPNMLSGKLDISSMNISSSSLGAKHEEHDEGINMDDHSDDSDVAAGPAGLKNLSNDSPPVPRIKILKVAPMENINQDYIIKIFNQISEEDDDNDDAEIENESSQDIGDEDNDEEAETISAEENNNESGEESDIEALLSIGIEIENDKESVSQSSPKTFERMPAKLDKRDRFSFSFYTEQSSKKLDAERDQQIPKKRVGFRTTEQDGDLKFDRVKLVGSTRKLPLSRPSSPGTELLPLFSPLIPKLLPSTEIFVHHQLFQQLLLSSSGGTSAGGASPMLSGIREPTPPVHTRKASKHARRAWLFRSNTTTPSRLSQERPPWLGLRRTGRPGRLRTVAPGAASDARVVWSLLSSCCVRASVVTSRPAAGIACCHTLISPSTCLPALAPAPRLSARSPTSSSSTYP